MLAITPIYSNCTSKLQWTDTLIKITCGEVKQNDIEICEKMKLGSKYWGKENVVYKAVQYSTELKISWIGKCLKVDHIC